MTKKKQSYSSTTNEQSCVNLSSVLHTSIFVASASRFAEILVVNDHAEAAGLAVQFIPLVLKTEEPDTMCGTNRVSRNWHFNTFRSVTFTEEVHLPFFTGLNLYCIAQPILCYVKTA